MKAYGQDFQQQRFQPKPQFYNQVNPSIQPPPRENEVNAMLKQILEGQSKGTFRLISGWMEWILEI